MVPYDASRVTPSAVRLLTEHAVREANRTHAAAHAAGFPALHDSPRPLVDALHQVERELGRPRPTIVAQPQTSWLSPFFRASGVSGMQAPFILRRCSIRISPDPSARSCSRTSGRTGRGKRRNRMQALSAISRPCAPAPRPNTARGWNWSRSQLTNCSRSRSGWSCRSSTPVHKGTRRRSASVSRPWCNLWSAPRGPRMARC